MTLGRSASPALDAQPKIAAFVAVSRLGVAVASLPEPWVVFRQNAFSPNDGATGAVYGGVYIALHPEKGMALIDLAPAEPAAALSGLRTVLRRAGLAPSALEQLPVVALVLTRDDIGTIGERLADCFAATRGAIAEPAWMEAVIAALKLRFPLLREVRRADDVAAEPVAPPPVEQVPPLAPSAASPDDPEQAPRSPRNAQDGANPPSARRSIIAVSGAIFALAVAALAALLLPMRDTARNAPSSVVATKPAGIVPPLPAASPTPIETVTRPSAAPTPAGPSPLVVPVPATAPVAKAAPAPLSAPRANEASPGASSPDRFFALPDVIPDRATSAASAPQTAPPPSAKPTKAATILVPPPSPNRAAVKPGAAQPDAAAPSIPRRAQHRAVELQPPPAPIETVTVDGITYVKGREPHSLGSVNGLPASASDASEGEGNAAANAGSEAPLAPATAPPLPLGPAPFAQH
jgi:hypothetical protein